jgi:hypothetical protein
VLVPPRPAAEPRIPTVAARRAAARAAARRRRHVLLVLVGADLVVTDLAAFALTPWWSASIPVALTLLYLVLCRTQVRRENDVLWAPNAAGDVAPRRAIRVDTSYGNEQASAYGTADGDRSDYEDTVQIPVAELQTVAVSVETADGGSLWDPLPVTLPTYVNKARASRSVRTIDLSAPDTWSSGRDEADTALVEQASVAESAEETREHEERRAVGS